MAQTIKLRRSSTEGKVPTTSQLALGEIAINTHDGRIFFEKNDGSATIQHIVTTNSITTGSIELTSKVTAATLTLSGLSAQNSEATSLMINGSGVVGTRELGTAAFSAATDFLTAHPNISAASSVDNSNGTVIQDVTLDSNGHVTGLASANLDGRYYTETESDTLFTKKLGQGIISGAAQIAAFTDLEIANPTVTGTLVSEDVIQFTGLSSTTETTAVMIDSSNELSKRTLGSNAFTSTTITPDGGNADTVDTLHASSFLRSDATDTAGSKITFSGGLNIPDSTNLEIGSDVDFVINDNGGSTFFQSKRHAGEVYFQCENTTGTAQNVIILGTDTSNTSKTYVELRYNNVERIKTTSGGSDMAGQVNFNGTTQSTSKTTGTVIIDGGVGIAKTLNVGEDVVAFASSDERYKDLITPIENPNEKIKLLSGNTFVWNDKHEVFKGKKDIGVIAQEVEKVLPEIVETRDNGY